MKRNLSSLKFILCCLILGFSTVAQAKVSMRSFKFQPYLGVEYQYQHIKPAKNYRSILSADAQTANLFAGTRIHRIFGIELGYYGSLKTAQQQYEMTAFNGQSTGGLTSVLTRTRFKGFSFDASLYYALDPNFDASLIFGFATMHPTMTFQATGNTAFARAFNSIKPKNATVPRMGLGLELLKKHWGLRSRILWVYTQNMKLNVENAQAIFPAITENPYAQALELTAGVFYRF